MAIRDLTGKRRLAGILAAALSCAATDAAGQVRAPSEPTSTAAIHITVSVASQYKLRAGDRAARVPTGRDEDWDQYCIDANAPQSALPIWLIWSRATPNLEVPGSVKVANPVEACGSDWSDPAPPGAGTGARAVMIRPE